MSCKYICDSCEVEADAKIINSAYYKPKSWYQRSGKFGVYNACSTGCLEEIERLAEETEGKKNAEAVI